MEKRLNMWVTIFLVFPYAVFAQEWLNFSCGKWVNALACYGDSIWAGTRGGLVLINRKSDSVTFFNKANSKLADIQISSLAVDSGGGLYIGSRWFQDFFGANDAFHLNDGSYVSTIVAAKDRTVYCGAGLNLRILKNGVWNSVQIGSVLSAKFNITAILVANRDSIWVVTNEGLFLVNGTSVIDTFFLAEKISAQCLNPNTPENKGVTEKGLLWFGTYNGLFLISGNSRVDTILHGEHISSLLMNRNGRLFVGTAEKGLKVYDGSAWTDFTTANSGIPNDTIISLLSDSKDNVWVFTKEGVAKYDGTKWTAYTKNNSDLPDHVIFSKIIDNKDNVWIGTMNHGVARFNGTVWKKYNTSNSPLHDGRCWSVVAGSGNELWIGDNGGILKIGNFAWTRYDTSNCSSLKSPFILLPFVPNWKLWTSPDVGIMLGSFPRPSYTAALRNTKKETKITCDRNGMPWAVMDNFLWNYDGAQWRKIEMTEFPSAVTEVSKVTFGYDGTLYCSAIGPIGSNFTRGSRGYLFSFYDSKWNTVYVCDTDHVISAFAIDTLNRFWLGSIYRWTVGIEYGKGLLSYDGQTWRQYTITNSGLPSNSVCELTFDSSGNLWVGTIGGGFAKFNCADKWTVYNWTNSKLTDNTVECIAIDNSGNKWLATQFGGLCVFNEKGILENTSMMPAPKNPFSLSLSMKFSILRISLLGLKPSRIILKLFDLKGRCLKIIEDGYFYTTGYSGVLDCRNLPNGTYFINFQIGTIRITKKILITR